jgi:hypothetical protein
MDKDGSTPLGQPVHFSSYDFLAAFGARVTYYAGQEDKSLSADSA